VLRACMFCILAGCAASAFVGADDAAPPLDAPLPPVLPDAREPVDAAEPVDAPIRVDAGWGSCQVAGEPGVCEDTSACDGVAVPGHCPGRANIQCCVAHAPETLDAAPRADVVHGNCPDDMVPVGDACMDIYEAPNRAGAEPLVMYTFVEAEAWCDARGKRLCFDDEWTSACAGPDGWAYPYGPTREPGRCNDDKVWRAYSQSALDGWPYGVSAPDIDTLDD